MRAWLVTAVVLAGCLHGTAPPRDPYLAAQETWRTHFLKKEYERAAEVAWKAKLDPIYVRQAFERFRQAAELRYQEYMGHRYKSDTADYAERMEAAYRTEIRIACRYALNGAVGGAAVGDVKRLNENVSVPELLYALLAENCPVPHDLRYEIIERAASWNKHDLALQEALRAPDWTENDALRLGLFYVLRRDCTRGFRIASLFSLKSEALSKLIAGSSCEEEGFGTATWIFPQQEARGAFFAAVRMRKYRLAVAFNRLSGGGEQELNYLAQEVFAQRDEYNVTDKMFLLSLELRDAIYAYALSHGRARYVGVRAKEIYWEEKAFDQLIAEGKFEDAAETAQYGPSPTMKTTGILAAFRAAVKAGNQPSFTYLWRRYGKIVPEQEYRDALQAWRPPPRKLPIKKLPPCPKDWNATRPPCQ